MNIHFPCGTLLNVPTKEDHRVMAAILEEFLDICEPAQEPWRNLPLRFLAWYQGTQDLGITTDPGPGPTVYVGWKSFKDDRPSTWW